MLRFHKQAYKFVRRSCWRILFLTSWGRFKGRFDNILEDLERHGEHVEKAANAYHIAEAHQMRQKLEEWRQESVAQLSKDDEEQTSSRLQAVSTWLNPSDADQTEIFDGVASEGTKYPGTCGWVLKNATMASWLRSKPESSFVWLRGNPGTGKSVLAAQLVNFLRSSPGSLIATHFCTQSYASSAAYDQILRSLLFQVIRGSDDMIEHVYWEYVVGRKAASAAALEQLFSTAVTALVGEPGQDRAVHVVVDGFDGVEAEKQRPMIRLLGKLAAFPSTGGGIKILLSSGATPLLEKLLRGKPTVSLSDEKEHLKEAIQIYAKQRLGRHRDRLRQVGLDNASIPTMADSIATRADGKCKNNVP